MGVFGIGGRGKDDGEEKGKLKLDPAQAARALPLLVAAGWRVEVHGWRKVKVKRGGKAIRWACRVVDMADDKETDDDPQD